SWSRRSTVTPSDALATSQCGCSDIPSITMMTAEGNVNVLTGPGIVVAVVLMFIYSFINVMGVKLFARFNNVLVWWKLAVIALVVIMFFSLDFTASNLTSQGFMPEGISSVFVAVPASGIAFSYLGFRNAVEY